MQDAIRKTVTGFTVDRTASGDSMGERLYSCDWCGSIRYTPKGHPTAFRYGSNDDWRGDSWAKGSFCSISCFRTYHD